ncbi:hypothetical protein BOX15_Mlig026729g1 [Macrostomum lignano]|uniref:LRAT domain-containing protein n=1 Tax=Macrostomum lignano TaxID=282301 RepID=A0A267H925_9PLAT|nr:hypothetical protein BOX15_Mlig026729g1 [Macrostomum lignano]
MQALAGSQSAQQLPLQQEAAAAVVSAQPPGTAEAAALQAERPSPITGSIQSYETLTPESIRNVRPGDVIQASGRSEAIVVEVEVKDGFFIFWTIYSKVCSFSGQIERRVSKDVLKVNIINSRRSKYLKPSCQLRHFPKSYCHPLNEVVRRAQSCLNEKIKWFGDSGFVLWCKTKDQSHRKHCTVPIYLPGNFETHQVKVGDHLSLKHDSGSIHAVVRSSEEMCKDIYLLSLSVSTQDLMKDRISFMNISERKFRQSKESKERVLVVKSVSKCVETEEFLHRIDLMRGLAYPRRILTLRFCLLLTDASRHGQDWRQQAAQMTNQSRPIRPLTQRVKAKNLQRGDIIFVDDAYRVVCSVVRDADEVSVGLVNYSEVDYENRKTCTLKYLIRKKETETTLCVHNDNTADCPLDLEESSPVNLAGIYSEEPVTLQLLQQLKKGDVMRLWYTGKWHRVIVEKLARENEKYIVTAIHYGLKSWLDAKTVIREDFVFKYDRQGTKQVHPNCFLCHFSDLWCHEPDVVVERARSRLNEREYSLIANCGTLFVVWCKTKSISHRADNSVPIFLGGFHTHEIKEGDHLEFNCCLKNRLHGEVTKVTKLNNGRKLLLELQVIKPHELHYVHTSELVLKTDKAVTRVIQYQSRVISEAELTRRIEFIENLALNHSESSFKICRLVTNSDRRFDDWKDSIWDALTQNEVQSNRRVLLESVTPNHDRELPVACDGLRVGDILHVNGVYRVVAGISTGSGQSSGQFSIKTLQYGSQKQNLCVSQLKYIIDAEEKDAKLCVHNDPSLNCQLYGGGSQSPAHIAEEVYDMQSISAGSVISWRDNWYSLYQHAVVVGNPVLPDGNNPHCATIDLIFYRDSWRGQIERQTLSVDLKKQKIYTIKYNVLEGCVLTPEEVIKRANDRLKEKQHNFQWNSSRDFARWCSIKHSSNREQCTVPVHSVQDLVEFERGHIKFYKSPCFYKHEAIMRSCSAVDGCRDIVRVELYENNHDQKRVRFEKLVIGPGESSIRRVNYYGFEEATGFAILEELTDCTFLNADDDRKGWTAKAKKFGCKVCSRDFCFWLRNNPDAGRMCGIQSLFGTELAEIQDKMKKLTKEKSLEVLEMNRKVELEDRVDRRSLRQYDHIILNRMVNGVVSEVDFILTEWDAATCSGVGVTYALPQGSGAMGVVKFQGFLRVADNQIQKVVHNSDLDWNQIDAKFNQLCGSRSYSLLSNNCEHFVNYLIYGRVSSTQLNNLAWRFSHFLPNAVQTIATAAVRILRLVYTLMQREALITTVAGSLIAEGGSVLLIGVVGLASHLLLQHRKAKFNMPQQEFLGRRRDILCRTLVPMIGLIIVGAVIHSAPVSAPIIGGAAGVGALVVGLAYFLPSLRARLMARMNP